MARVRMYGCFFIPGVDGECVESPHLLKKVYAGALAIGPPNRTAIWFLEPRKGLESIREQVIFSGKNIPVCQPNRK